MRRRLIAVLQDQLSSQGATPGGSRQQLTGLHKISRATLVLTGSPARERRNFRCFVSGFRGNLASCLPMLTHPTNSSRARRLYRRGAALAAILAALLFIVLENTPPLRWLETGTYDARMR